MRTARRESLLSADSIRSSAHLKLPAQSTSFEPFSGSGVASFKTNENLVGGSNMNAITLAIIAFFAVAVIVAVGAMIWLYSNKRRTKELRSQFGPEYGRLARAQGDTAKAEHLLQERAQRVKKLDIKPLTEAQRNNFADEWEHTQAQFVDDPTAALTRADALVQEVMTVRGYPVADFDQREADV